MRKISLLFSLMMSLPVLGAGEVEQKSNLLSVGGGLVSIAFPTPATIEQNIVQHCGFSQPAISYPVACQQTGSFVFNFGKDKITKLGLKDIITSGIDPFGLFNDRESLKQRILVGTGLMIAGATIVGTCPPIPVAEGWSDLSFFERLDRAQAFGYVPPAIPYLSYDVDQPLDPNSCTKTLGIEIDVNSGAVIDFSDFEGREFAYTAPFGSYPSATTEIATTAPGVASCLAAMTDLVDISTGLSVNVTSIDIDLGADVQLDDLLDGLADKVIDAIGLSDFELVASQQFNGWTSSYRANNPSHCTNSQCQFEHGYQQVLFDADINPASWGNLVPNVTYFQELDVIEYFDPVLTAFPLTVQLEALEIGGTRVSKYPPRAFMGNPPVDRNYTFDKSWLGVVDNCDTSPTINMEVPDFLPLGIHDFPVTVTDRVGNVTQDTVRIIVDDTIPPDLLPQPPVGILVPDGTSAIGFDDPGIGCDTYLCEGKPPQFDIFPPTYFDFGSLTPTVGCEMDNSLNTMTCAGSQLPVNAMSTVNWDIADPSGNVTSTSVDVYVREASINQTPTTPDQSYTVGQNNPVEVPLNAVDGDFDPLMFSVIDQPNNGNVDGDPEAIFQTRFNSTGLLASSNGLAYVHDINAGAFGMLIAAAAEQKVYLFQDSGFGELVNRFDLDESMPGGITPHAITFDGGKMVESSQGNLSRVLRNEYLWIGDWDDRKVYRYREPNGNSHQVQEMFSLPAGLQSPSGISAFRSGSTVTVVITDQQDQQLWRFEVNANTQTLLNTNSFNIGLSPDHVEFSSNTGQVYISSKTDKQVDLYSFSQGTILSWPITTLIDDPDGDDPALPLLQNAVDIYIESDGGSTTRMNWFDATEFKWVETRFNNNSPGTEPTIHDTIRLPSFVEILALEEFDDNGTTRFVVLAEAEFSQRYLIRYDLQGRIDALISLYNSQSPSPLPPASQTGYVDIAVRDNGEILLLEEGDSNNVPYLNVLTLQSGVDSYQSLGSSTVVDFMGNDSFPKAVDIKGDEAIILGSRSVASYHLGTENDTLLFNTALNEFADVAVNDNGEFFLSQTNTNLIKKYLISDGSFQLNIGGTELDFNGDTQYGRLFYDDVLGKLWVSDFANVFYPDLGDDGETHRMPRLLSYGSTGNLLDLLTPEGTPGDFFSFLEPGDFGTITAISAGDDGRFYVAETQPLNRLHVFDSQIFVEVACQSDPDGQVCNLMGYTPNNGFTGTESLTIMASDPFGAASAEATVTINVIDDQLAPVVTCPAAIEVQANSANGFTANLAQPEKEIDETMRGFLLGTTFTENTDLPPVNITHDIPAELLLGENSVTFIGTDGSGNTGDCQTSITVVDTLKPVFPDLVELNYEAIGPLSDVFALGIPIPSPTDNTTINNVVISGPTQLPIGENIITWVATDIADNQGLAKQVIRIVDTTAPVISGAADSNIHSNDTLTPISYSLPTVSDLVTPQVSLSCLPALNTLVGQGENPVSCVATDEANNQSNVTFGVDVFGDSNHFDTGFNQFSDAINGGQTDFSITTSGSFSDLTYDAPTPDLGLVYALMFETQQLGSGSNQSDLVACGGNLVINGLNFEDILLDDITERFGDRAMMTCNNTEVTSHIGSLVGEFTATVQVTHADTDTLVDIDLNTGNHIQISDRTIQAWSSNLSNVMVHFYGLTYVLAPGQQVLIYGPNDLIFRSGVEPLND